MGSTGNWKKVSFLNNPQYRKYNIVTAGDNDKIINGPNVFSYAFVNSSKLFEIVDLVICHGGNGTIYQALSYGIPVLCRTFHLEQDYNADGLERRQLGKLLDDIKDDTAYDAVIDEWMQKKGSRELIFMKNKIAEAASKFDQIIGRLVEQHFRSVENNSVN
jgi:UDP:flavonoid glycosyltransferase YjiC (YdhE family)